MTSWGDVEAEEAGINVGTGSVGLWVGRYPFVVNDTRARLMVSIKLKVEAGVW